MLKICVFMCVFAVDVNECDTANGGCADTCTNSDGSFACSCGSGYVLNADGVSCDGKDGMPGIFSPTLYIAWNALFQDVG